jgi:hypothetical protein
VEGDRHAPLKSNNAKAETYVITPRAMLCGELKPGTICLDAIDITDGAPRSCSLGDIFVQID